MASDKRPRRESHHHERFSDQMATLPTGSQRPCAQRPTVPQHHFAAVRGRFQLRDVPPTSKASSRDEQCGNGYLDHVSHITVRSMRTNIEAILSGSAAPSGSQRLSGCYWASQVRAPHGRCWPTACDYDK